DLAPVVLRDHVQHDAADGRDAGVAGDEDDPVAGVVGQQKVAERTFDRNLRARLELLERHATAAFTDADAELHRLRTLRRRGDGVRARHPLGEAEIYPLAGSELKVAV